MDAIRAQVTAMAQEEATLRSRRLAEMNDAQKTALASSLLSGLLGILLTVAIGFLIRRATLARRREEWLQSGQVGLASAMMGDQPIDQLAVFLHFWVATLARLLECCSSAAPGYTGARRHMGYPTMCRLWRSSNRERAC